MKEIVKERYDTHFWQARLNDLVEHYRPYSANGRNADYIPALGEVDSKQLGICVAGPDRTVIKSGDWDIPFTLQSISKVISFVAACVTKGIPYVLDRVDVEPTGDAFNSIIRLEMHKPGKPFNPMINAGALTVASILPGESAQQKIETIYAIIEKMIGKRPVINEDVFRSEWQTAHRNRALAHYLKETGFLEAEVEETLGVYLKQCSIEGNTEDIALIGLILANDGYHPFRGEQVIPKDVAKLTKALMLTCGMYNASGKFAAFVGIPAKSGVSGGIMCAVPASLKRNEPFQHGCGIGIYGPAIDEYGNSLTGGMLLKQLAQEWDLSIF
ncbi:glutaminase [Bacillus sonorensis]|uniref:glutaminase n=1 Tax=Bacillus sonorensis TaxID=119858 RepID=UPI00227EEA52|nr:glutaminase [Bacillus sonorensis]MCZ0070009.1 glutaminase [Bacillus sonorensis]MCZ0097397.1 glutaminase [Bacillus sonorensis]MEC1355185.1 glutaminase [Bacillus sonorensis]MEC1424646.1 glutaminase [Bacillus sonorensis]MEC1516868.1 glutaminase [Bacillus sonorensis]